MLANPLTLGDIITFLNSVFFGHGNMKHGDPGWRGTHDLLYYIYFIPVQSILLDSIVFAYGRIFCY